MNINSSGFGIQYSIPTPIRIITLNYNQSISSVFNESSLSVSIPPITIFGGLLSAILLLAYPGNDAGAWVFGPFALLSMVFELNVGIGFDNFIYNPLNINKYYLIFPLSFNINLPLFFLNNNLDRHTVKLGADYHSSDDYNSIIWRFGYSFSF